MQDTIEWTEAELKWLEERGKPDYPAACVRFLKEKWDFNQEECKFCCYSDRERRILLCPLAPDYKDAAEFEARVARKLAEKIPLAMMMTRVDDSDFIMDAETALMLARLDVEKKMEAERC